MENQDTQHTSENDDLMLGRREVIRRALMATGAASLVGSTALLNAACSAPEQRTEAAAASGYSTDQVAWLDEVAETILPETDTPGAKAAQTGAFIALMVKDTYTAEEQAQFHAGMEALEAECRQEAGVGFMAASPAQRLALLERLDREALAQEGDTPHYFTRLKQLTVLGYFTSEIGYNQALRYVESPGRFDPCVDYEAGTPMWARHA